MMRVAASLALSGIMVGTVRPSASGMRASSSTSAYDEIFTENCVFYEARDVHRGRDEIDRYTYAAWRVASFQ
jgi:hypothetical protein